MASPRRWPFLLFPPDGAPDEEERRATATGRKPGFLLAPAATVDAALAARSSSILCKQNLAYPLPSLAFPCQDEETKYWDWARVQLKSEMHLRPTHWAKGPIYAKAIFGPYVY